MNNSPVGKDESKAVDSALASSCSSEAVQETTAAAREVMAHTQGPWRCEGPDCFDDYNILPNNDTTGALAGVVNNGRPPEEVAANARLMAAAPDLLEACERAKQFLIRDYEEPGRTVFWKLVAALRKARGDL